jgi:ribosomal protein S18 acetylase RimI-like enzyme
MILFVLLLLGTNIIPFFEISICSIKAWAFIIKNNDFINRQRIKAFNHFHQRKALLVQTSALQRQHIFVTNMKHNKHTNTEDTTIHYTETANSESISSSSTVGMDNDIHKFHVRDCTHDELKIVADIIMDSFYNYTTNTAGTTTAGSSIWKQVMKLAELNRIQQNFPYGPDKAHHRMMIVTCSTTPTQTTTTTTTTNPVICGFVDIDTRIPNRPTSYKYNPRPYLSDLCIHPSYRRYGLATLLINACEEFCRNYYSTNNNNIIRNNNNNNTDNNILYIRVETKNIIAIQMYQKLGYNILYNHDDMNNNSNILILYKVL